MAKESETQYLNYFSEEICISKEVLLRSAAGMLSADTFSLHVLKPQIQKAVLEVIDTGKAAFKISDALCF